MTDGKPERYPSVEDFLRAQSKLLNRQSFYSFLLVMIFGFIFMRWVLSSEPGWLIAAFVLGPVALSLFMAAMKNSDNFGKLQRRLSEEVVVDRVALCVLLGNKAPAQASHMRFHPVEQVPVRRYVPLQWWSDGRALQAVDREAFKEVEVYRETLLPWEEGDFQDSIMVSLDKVFHDLFKLEELGAVSQEMLRGE